MGTCEEVGNEMGKKPLHDEDQGQGRGWGRRRGGFGVAEMGSGEALPAPTRVGNIPNLNKYFDVSLKY